VSEPQTHIGPTATELHRVGIRLLKEDDTALTLFCMGCGKVYAVQTDRIDGVNWFACPMNGKIPWMKAS